MIEYTELTRAVKNAALQAIKESDPANAKFGTVVSIDPITIDAGYKQPIGAPLIIIPEYFQRKEYTVTNGSHTHTVTIDNSLKIGDKVVMLRMIGGQRHIVLGVL